MWLTGRCAEAEQLSRRTLDLSQELQHPFTRALAFSFGSWLHQWRGDVELVHQYATDSHAVAKEQGFAFWIGWNEIMLGWARAAGGDPHGGLDLMARGLSNWHAVGSELGTTYFLTLMAEAQRDAGHLDEAWRSLDAADEVAERTREGWWSPEVRRLRGELLWRRGSPIEEVEHQLTLARELAVRRSAWSLAMRASLTLAELRREQGRDPEARRLLEDALSRFPQASADGDPAIPRARAMLDSIAYA